MLTRHRNYLNAVEDAVALSDMIAPDSQCQQVTPGDGTPPPSSQPMQCPPCDCNNAKKFMNIFWIVVITATVVSFISGGEDKALTGGSLS